MKKINFATAYFVLDKYLGMAYGNALPQRMRGFSSSSGGTDNHFLSRQLRSYSLRLQQLIKRKGGEKRVNCEKGGKKSRRD